MKKLLLIMPRGTFADRFTELVAQDFEVLRVENEEEGFAALDDDPGGICAVLVDLELTRSTDLFIVKKMDADRIFASIPVIALSEREPGEEDRSVFEEGFSELLTPPWIRELIVKRIINASRAKDSFTYSEMQKMLARLPSNIYLKDGEGKYVFATQYWNHLKKEGEKHWTIRGKTDIEIRKDKENAIMAMQSDRELLRTGKGTEYIIEERIDGVVEYLELIKRPVFDEDGKATGIIALINNVTEKQLMKQELEKRSNTDRLTGLLNRGATEDLVRMILDSRRDDNLSALMMIDVDNFKNVNDQHGHIAGDRVLATIGRLIANNFKGSDVTGRFGGDEFMVLMRDIGSEKNALSICDKLQKDLKNAFGGELKGCVTLSIGVAICPMHGTNFEDLYRAADNALYYVKHHGKSGAHVM